MLRPLGECTVHVSARPDVVADFGETVRAAANELARLLDAESAR